MFALNDIELNDFLSIWTLNDGPDITVCFSCWTKEEATRAAQRLHELTSCQASIELHDELSARCTPRLAWDRPFGVGWCVYFPESPEDQDWNFQQLEGFDTWLETVLVNIQDADYMPTGSLKNDPEVSRRLAKFASIREGSPEPDTHSVELYELPSLDEDCYYEHSVLDEDAFNSGGLPSIPKSLRRGPFTSFENAMANARLIAAEKGIDVNIKHEDVVTTQWFIDWEEPSLQSKNRDSTAEEFDLCAKWCTQKAAPEDGRTSCRSMAINRNGGPDDG